MANAVFLSERTPGPARTLVDVLGRAAATCPDAPALDDGHGVLTYAGLLAEAAAVAERLGELGIGPGERVGVRVPSGTAALYVAILGVLTAGAAYVPVDADDPDERAELVFAEADVAAIIGLDTREFTRRPAARRLGAASTRDGTARIPDGTAGVGAGAVVGEVDGADGADGAGAWPMGEAGGVSGRGTGGVGEADGASGGGAGRAGEVNGAGGGGDAGAGGAAGGAGAGAGGAAGGAGAGAGGAAGGAGAGAGGAAGGGEVYGIAGGRGGVWGLSVVVRRVAESKAQSPLPGDDAWIIFTSGSTGKPKGVAVSHRSAAAFVDAEAGLFLREAPIAPGDRVLAGLSVAFDASCEEMWLAWRNGACLVPAPRALVRTGMDLGPWLVERGITVVSTVPTLAALWPVETLAGVRLLIFGGEACPPELAERLSTPGREVWNTYGPTEATVVACAALLKDGGPVRIGLPLAGWDLAVVDRDGRPVTMGETGELVIGGVGLARYLDVEKDREKYGPLEALGWERAYRSGDLVVADPEGLLFVGRADEQVKLGGRRIELGEVEAALLTLPGVGGAAAAVKSHEVPTGAVDGREVPTAAATGREGATAVIDGRGGAAVVGGREGATEAVDGCAGAAGGSRDGRGGVVGKSQVLVGYVVAGEDFDVAAARKRLAEMLPQALVPRLVVVGHLPTRTSGKIDRDALPWPVADAGTLFHGTERWLADRWQEVLGARPEESGADFFTMGGGSLSAAQLVSVLRSRYPGVAVADLYDRPTLSALAAHLDTLGHTPAASGRRVRPMPRRAALVQSALMLPLLTVRAVPWVLGAFAVGNLLGLSAVSWWWVAAGVLAFVTPPGRIALAAGAARLLLRGVRPGDHPRGGAVHLRLWFAEQLAAGLGVGGLAAAPWITFYARALGNRVGQDADLHALPPVTGLLRLGKAAAVEPEVDLAGHWLDGDRLRIGEIRIGAGASVGARSTLLPDTRIGKNAQIAPGSSVSGEVPGGQRWAGAPAVRKGKAAPRGERPPRYRRWTLAYGLSALLLSLIPLVAAVPGVLVLAAARGLPAVVGATVVSMAAMALLLLVAVRLLAIGLRAGSHPVHSRVAWQAWATERLMSMARVWLFPLYASAITPVWLRLLGMRVGREAELSTVLALPTMTEVGDGAFLADDTKVAPYELAGGRLRVGHVRIGKRAFVGNSGMTAPGRKVPKDGLVGVLSAAPKKAKAGSSYLGMPPVKLRRTAQKGDTGRTYDPPTRLRVARALVEACRLVPVVATAGLAVAVVLALARIAGTAGPGAAVLLGGVVLALAGGVAAAVTVAAKWLLMGRIRAGERPLWSSFVWRGELADNFVEVLAAPWFATPWLGTAPFNLWLRALGARIGRGVWCETYWLPEIDLVTVGDGASVNRGCVLQTHLFHDRVMSVDTVELAEGSTLGPHGVVLPAASVGSGTTIGPASLVMRGERLPARTRWYGNPVAAWHRAA
ncbi:Pls/PosA family non-ribosomal peptide synthetase [Nonomuraea longicatena]|uniref:Pls/PosA family non-ribosomal peptide synthetase n=1 Tax=Nonomuraea longicatena TaxID=83682 RepID=UPI0031D33BFD